MSSPYLKFAGPVLDDATIEGVADVLRSGQIASGPWVQRVRGGALARSAAAGRCAC